jgi:hypothetical protein
MRDFDWNYDTTHPECAAALAAAIAFCSDCERAHDAAKAINAMLAESWQSRCDAAREAGTMSPPKPERERATGRWLTLLGKSGRGKSHLAKRIEVWRRGKGDGRFYYRWPAILEQMRNDRENISLFMERARDRKVLIIDDIGAAHETEFAAAVLCDIADTRIGLPTVFTSNLSIEGISKMDARIASRMFRDGSEVFTFKAAPDWAVEQRRAVSI